MYRPIKRWLKSLNESNGDGGEEAFPADDPRLSAAAILVHIVAVDGVITDDERDGLRRVLADRYGLAREQVEELIRQAKKRDEDAVDLYGFTSVLKRVLDEDGRRNVIEMMWEMSYADGHLSEFEDNTIWRVAELLGISNRDRIAIRKRVETRLGDAPA